MSLHSLVSELATIAVDVNNFGELVSITVPGEAISRDLYCTLESANTLKTGEYIDRELERISVRCGRDESSPQGGIANPLRRTTLRRAGDTADQEYVYTGEITEQWPSWQTLVFERQALARAGVQRDGGG